MEITSFAFLIFLCIGGGIYYVLPKAWQWTELLIFSLIFYYFAATPYTLIFIVVSTGMAWVATNYPFRKSVDGNRETCIAGVLAIIAIFLNAVLWFVLKGSKLWIPLIQKIGKIMPLEVFNTMPVAASLGMGYYTLQCIGYILDCRWGTAKPQKNFAKLFLFLLFFPQLITGPISRYNDLQSLYEQHSFDYVKMTFGVQRILWGFVKKLVLAERLAIIIGTIWNDLDNYTGYYCLIAMLLFPIQIYADFSGCMDIVIGTAEIFGIYLKENFKTPFFSRTVQEFWQRWHITLGSWGKDYILYPFLKSKCMINLGKMLRKRFGKKVGKFIPTAIGMFLLWMIISIWHGSFRYVVGVGLWYWAILMMGKICEPLLEKISEMLYLSRECFSWHLYQSIRTYIIFAIGGVFFCASDFEEGISFFKGLMQIFHRQSNIWVIFEGKIIEMVGGNFEFRILIVSFVLLAVAECLYQKYGSVRKWIAGQGIIFRWMIWIGMIFFVWLFGIYGSEYDMGEFIYARF
ncbi:MAG: hypothetical protein K2P14_01365 [Anaeroplasmataceae bacterium]|nr:hypothetical protein [Anaeroplasmataceae bacterium]